MSEVLKIIKARRSVRKYQDKEIPAEMIEKLKEALIWAPSAGNLQARKFYFVFKKELRVELTAKASLYHQAFIAQAPLVIVACTDEKKMERYGERGRELYLVNDVSSAIQNAMLVATELGLGSCWVGAFDEGAVRKILDLPAHERPVALLPVGYPDEKPANRGRVSAAEAIKEI